MKKHPELAKIFGKVLRQQRLLTDKMSQLELARKSSLEVRHIRNLENGHRAPCLQTFLLLAKGLGMSSEEFMAKLTPELKE